MSSKTVHRLKPTYYRSNDSPNGLYISGLKLLNGCELGPELVIVFLQKEIDAKYADQSTQAPGQMNSNVQTKPKTNGMNSQHAYHTYAANT